MIGQSVELADLEITYPNGFTAVSRTSFSVAAGEFFSVLGPSGCGKTTLLRTISGFQEPTRGRVLIGSEDQNGVGPNNRPTALIFQNLALFPLMSVQDNVAFGLESRGVGKRERRRKARDLLDLVELSSQAEKLPSELSGGQKQRVAIARALAVEPALLLLDEPLSALDLKLRQHMRSELRSIQKRTGVTFIYITHDQGEALSMSDRIAIMNAGMIEQIGHGGDIYTQPASAFVASFVGESNRLEGTVTRTGDYIEIDTILGPIKGHCPSSINSPALQVGGRAYAFIRPENVGVRPALSQPEIPGSGGKSISACVTECDLEGPYVMLHAEISECLGNKPIFKAHMRSNEGQPFAPGSDIMLEFDDRDVQILPFGPLAQTSDSTSDGDAM